MMAPWWEPKPTGYYILLCGAAGVLLYLLKKLRKEEKA